MFAERWAGVNKNPAVGGGFCQVVDSH
jgi:hypothetical protein